jgi:hypothetical protein
MIFNIQKRMRAGAVVLGALIASFTVSEVDATPVIPPGFSAAVFDTNIDSGYNAITNITIFTQTSNNTGFARPFRVSPGPGEFLAVVPPGGGVVQSAFAAGVIAGLPGDPSGNVINHLVVFGDFTSAELNLDFASLFPDISESTVINDLLNTPPATPLPSSDVKAFTADAKADGLYGGNDSSFDAVAFSIGTVIGDGTVTLLPAPTPVPEPFTLSLFAAGLVGATALTRRKKNAA